ncbi:MAG: ATP-binding cassette domain-containing protein [Oscillospiraceae bacterium]|nr:ATP-binding cassette domain-containing protein [Oscillospiraceae bacterium]
MKQADFDQKNCDKEYAKNLIAACNAKYEALLSRASESEKAALQAEYKNELRKAKKTKLVTQIQMIFQDPIASLDPRMTVKEIIAEGLVIQGERDPKIIEEKVFEMLELVGLVREHASRYPHEFSGGQRQRIGVARAVIMNPDLIIADEPVSALDVSVQAQVINLLNELRHNLGLTILFIAHDLSVVKYFSDRIGVMYFGKMVELADSDELFLNPMHPYTKSLLSAIPLPDPIYEKNRQRITYNPLASHDYTVDKPSFREIKPGHFVMCNDEEFARYQSELK